MNNKINSTKKWEILFYGAILDFCREYMNIGNNVIVELKFKKTNLKNKSFGDINLLNPKNIIAIENASLNSTIGHVLHEFTHIKQKIKKELKAEKSLLLWKNTPIISVKDYNKITFDHHKNLPWEAEARHNENLVSNFYRSRYMQNLKGKDATIDYIFMTSGI